MYRREASSIELCGRVSNTSVGGARGVSSGWGWGVKWVGLGLCPVGRGGGVKWVGVWCVSNGVEQDKTVSRVPNH